MQVSESNGLHVKIATNVTVALWSVSSDNSALEQVLSVSQPDLANTQPLRVTQHIVKLVGLEAAARIEKAWNGPLAYFQLVLDGETSLEPRGLYVNIVHHATFARISFISKAHLRAT